MRGSQVLCFVILFVTMTIAFVIGSILVKLLFYSSTHGFDDTRINAFDDWQDSPAERLEGSLRQHSATCDCRHVPGSTAE